MVVHGHTLRKTFVFTGCLLAAVALQAAAAEPAVKVSFDGPSTNWRLISNSESARLLVQEVAPAGARDASGAERLVVAAAAGQSVLVTCPTGRMPVVDEFLARMWVNSSHPGVSLAARVVLPRSIDSISNAPKTVIVRGDPTLQAGNWQQLELSNMPRRLAEQVRVQRATAPGKSIDPSEAFVDAIVVVIPGIPQGVELLTDDLQVDGVLFAAAEARSSDGPQLHAASAELSSVLKIPSSVRRNTELVRLQSGVLHVEGKPFSPRAIEWNGEPLDFLAARGFNTVVLREPPTPGQLTLAERHDLWFICPPPNDFSQHAAIGGSWDRVLAWRLLDDEALDRPDHFRNWVEMLADQSKLPARPVVLTPRIEWTALSEIGDIILARHPLDVHAEPSQFGGWLAERRRLVRPGAPLWVSIGTQFNEASSAQAAALLGEERASLNVDEEHIDTLVRVALMDGCRGIIFRSTLPLDASDAPTQRRAAMLAQINRRLRIIGPWMAAGTLAGELISTDGKSAAGMLLVDRSHLLVSRGLHLPVENIQSKGTTPPGNAPPTHAAFTVPGVPDASRAWSISPAALSQIEMKRVAGGMRIVVESAEDSLVVITQDAQAISNLKVSTTRDGAAAVRLARDVAAMKTRGITERAKGLAEFGVASRDAELVAEHTATALRQADAYLSAGRSDAAFTLISVVNRRLNEFSRRQREAVRAQESLISSPLLLSNDTLAEHLRFARGSQSYSPGENLLAGGDFEDLSQLAQFGWQHFNVPIEGVTTSSTLR